MPSTSRCSKPSCGATTPEKEKPMKIVKKSTAIEGAKSMAMGRLCCTVELDGQLRCAYPGCARMYASRDAVRKHCRLQHHQWLKRLDTMAVEAKQLEEAQPYRKTSSAPTDKAAEWQRIDNIEVPG